MSENHHIVRIEWHIKGYHVFRIKPHTDLELQVSHDVNNRYDEHAMKVCCPSVQEIPSHLLRASAFRQRHNACLVKDIAGKSNLFQVTGTFLLLIASIEVLVQFAKLCLANKHAQVCNSFIWLDLILYTPVNNLHYVRTDLPELNQY